MSNLKRANNKDKDKDKDKDKEREREREREREKEKEKFTINASSTNQKNAAAAAAAAAASEMKATTETTVPDTVHKTKEPWDLQVEELNVLNFDEDIYFQCVQSVLPSQSKSKAQMGGSPRVDDSQLRTFLSTLNWA